MILDPMKHVVIWSEKENKKKKGDTLPTIFGEYVRKKSLGFHTHWIIV